MKTPRLAFLFLALTWALASHAQSKPEDKLRASVDDVLAVLYGPQAAQTLEERETRLTAIMKQRYSFDQIAQRSLGRNWPRFSPEQQATFSELFSQLLIRTYVRRFNTELGEPTISWGPTRTLPGNRAEVPSAVTVDNTTVAVVYRLEQINNDWQIYDVLVEGVSLVGNYRKQFDTLLRRQGPEEMLAELRKLIASS